MRDLRQLPYVDDLRIDEESGEASLIIGNKDVEIVNLSFNNEWHEEGYFVYIYDMKEHDISTECTFRTLEEVYDYVADITARKG